MNYRDNPESPEKTLAYEMAMRKDELISNSITTALGYSVWKLIDVVHRLNVVICKDREIWIFDGRPLVEFLPLELKIIQEGVSTKAVATQSYMGLIISNLPPNKHP